MMINTNKKPLSDEAMNEILKNHIRISSEAKQRIADNLFAKLEQKKSPSLTINHSRGWMKILALAASVIITVMLFFTFKLTTPSSTLATVVKHWNDCRIIKDNGIISKIETGTKLTVGDLLITGPTAGISIKTEDGSFVSIGRNSKLECVAPRGEKKCTFSLHSGSILAKVSPNKAKLFSVKTPNTLLKVLGTEFEAKVTGNTTNKTGNKKMNIAKIKSKTTAFTMLTVLSGVVAVNSAKAADTLVESGSTANITAETGISVDKVKTLSFIKSVIRDNYKKQSSVWFKMQGSGHIVSTLFRYNINTGKTKTVGDFIGGVSVATHFGGGALLDVNSIFLNSTSHLSLNSGNPLAKNGLMLISNSGKILNLSFLSKYSPWYPALSPDGSKLAFLGRQGSKGGLYVLDLKTMSIKTVASGAMKTIAAWSPDSSKILISKNSGYTKKHQIISIDINSGKIENTKYNGCNVVFSPNGKQIAFPGEFKRSGHWYRGVPVSGDIFVADYPNGKARKITSSERAIEPSFSPDGKKLAYYVNVKRQYELHVIDLESKLDKEICKTGSIGSTLWADNNKIIVTLRHKPLIKEIELSGSSIVVRDVEMNVNGSSALALQKAIEPAFKLYLAGLRSSCLNKLDEASSNYNEAYETLLAFKRSKQMASEITLDVYLAKFKEMADMSKQKLYTDVLEYRMALFPSMLNHYTRKFKKLPASMEDFAKYIPTACSYNYVRAKTPEAKMQMLMPDQAPDDVTAFEMKVIDDKNIEFYSASTPWGNRFKIHAVKKRNRWRRKGKVELVKTP
jgi:FecR-like protein/WD40 repeat protein